MKMYDLIEKKKRGTELTPEEIQWFVRGVTDESIPDEQITAFLMAVYFKGLTEAETFELTFAMRDSGDVMDLSAVKGVCVDKHSTGGVGDKVSLVLLPILASCGLPVVKMSGRGLGHTGGTIDKLESISGFRTDLSEDEFIDIVNRCGGAICGANKSLAPADKRLYALRDSTATVDEISLIASSIMSKKLAAGADAIVLDVTTGDGAFMKDADDARKLASLMVRIGKSAGKDICAYITDMDEPLGFYIGNSLEVYESILALCGKGPEDLMRVVSVLGGAMLRFGGICATANEGEKMISESVTSGKALDKFKEIITAQGGDPACVSDPEILVKAPVVVDVVSEKEGYVSRLLASQAGHAVKCLGGGRDKKEDIIDPLVGVQLFKKIGDHVSRGEALARIYASDEAQAALAADEIKEAYEFSDKSVIRHDVIIDYVED